MSKNAYYPAMLLSQTIWISVPALTIVKIWEETIMISFHCLDRKEKILRLAVGDVSGHGTAAALLMAMAKGALQAEIEHSPDNLVEVLRRLNRFFYQDTGSEGMFMTLFLARLDVRAMELNWCSAGQGPVYVYHPQEQYFEELDSTGHPARRPSPTMPTVRGQNVWRPKIS